jgi:hypothetical protein
LAIFAVVLAPSLLGIIWLAWRSDIVRSRRPLD